jgi:DNA repair protein RadC
MKSCKHPGGKLLEEGAGILSERELLAIIISTGIPGKSALEIAGDVLEEFGTLQNLAGKPLETFLRFRGLSDVKIIRIAAALEIGRRLGEAAWARSQGSVRNQPVCRTPGHPRTNGLSPNTSKKSPR